MIWTPVSIQGVPRRSFTNMLEVGFRDLLPWYISLQSPVAHACCRNHFSPPRTNAIRENFPPSVWKTPTPALGDNDIGKTGFQCMEDTLWATSGTARYTTGECGYKPGMQAVSRSSPPSLRMGYGFNLAFLKLAVESTSLNIYESNAPDMASAQSSC